MTVTERQAAHVERGSGPGLSTSGILVAAGVSDVEGLGLEWLASLTMRWVQ